MSYRRRGNETKRRRLEHEDFRGPVHRRMAGDPSIIDEADLRRGEDQPVLPSRIIQINNAEELTEDDIRSAVEVFGEIGGVVSPTRDTFLIEYLSLESSQALHQHSENHGFLIRYISPEIKFGSGQDLPSAMTTFQNSKTATSANNVLQFNVMKPMYPITTEVLYTIASPHGRVLRIVIHNRTPEIVESLVEFDGIPGAENCRNAIDGADIYSGCCTLDVKFSKAQSLNVFKNDDDTFDYTDINPAIAAKQRSSRDYREPEAERRPARSNMSRPPPRPGHASQQPQYLGSNSSGEQRVLMIHGLDTKMNPERMFNILCMYGDVNKIKFLTTKKGVALVEMKNLFGAENAQKFLNRVRVFGSAISVSHSKHREVGIFGPMGKCDDGTDALQVFTDNRYLRFRTRAKASKNRIVEPSKILQFYALPTCIDENWLLKLLEDKDCPTPNSISMNKSDICSSGLLEYDNTEEAVDTVAIANHLSGIVSAEAKRYCLKLAFTGRRVMPDNPMEDVAKAGDDD